MWFNADTRIPVIDTSVLLSQRGAPVWQFWQMQYYNNTLCLYCRLAACCRNKHIHQTPILYGRGGVQSYVLLSHPVEKKNHLLFTICFRFSWHTHSILLSPSNWQSASVSPNASTPTSLLASTSRPWMCMLPSLIALDLRVSSPTCSCIAVACFHYSLMPPCLWGLICWAYTRNISYLSGLTWCPRYMALS